MTIEVMFTNEEIAKLYRKKGQGTSLSAGFDLRADYGGLSDSVTLHPGLVFCISTGIKLNMTTHQTPIFGLVTPRSSLGRKGLVLTNTVGIIDQDYQDEILLYVRNDSRKAIEVERGERIAQLIIQEYVPPVFQEVEQFSNTTGRGGFGSTGRK